MTHTAANFNVTNATSTDIANLNLALSYLDSSPTGSAILQALIGTTINIVHNGSDSYGGSFGKTIDWDPLAGLAVTNNDVHGVQSAALGLLHEAAHATDPNYRNSTLSQQESYATNKETTVAGDLHEPARDTYADNSGPVRTSNTTEHTNASYQWQETEQDGTITTGGSYGPVINPNQAPVITPPVGGGNEGGGDEGGSGGGGSGGPRDGDPPPVFEESVPITKHQFKTTAVVNAVAEASHLVSNSSFHSAPHQSNVEILTHDAMGVGLIGVNTFAHHAVL